VNSEYCRNTPERAESIQTEKQELPEVLFTKKELARKLRISERKIELDDQMPTIRWGRTVRYDWGEVLEYLKGKRG